MVKEQMTSSDYYTIFGGITRLPLPQHNMLFLPNFDMKF